MMKRDLQGITMRKEAGASGQILLGKKYAGQVFDMQPAADGSVTLVPVNSTYRVQEESSGYLVTSIGAHGGDDYLTPERMARRAAAAVRTPADAERARDRWEADNHDAIDAMNRRITKIGSMASRIHEWRKSLEPEGMPSPATDGKGS